MSYSMILVTYFILLFAAPSNAIQTNGPSIAPTVVSEQTPSIVGGNTQIAGAKPQISLTAQPTAQPMWTDITQAICTIGTFLVAVLGFALVIRQLMQVEKTLRKDALESLYERAFAIQSIILQEPQLRPFFYDSIPVPSDATVLAKLEIFSEMVFDFYELIVDEKDFMSAELSLSWEVYLADMYRRSPTLRRHLEINSSWYSHAVCTFFQQHKTT